MAKKTQLQLSATPGRRYAAFAAKTAAAVVAIKGLTRFGFSPNQR